MRKPNIAKIEFTGPDEGEFDGTLVGSGVLRKGKLIYRVTLRAGQKPQCTINGEDYVDPPGGVDRVMWELLVAVRQRFNA